MSLDGKIATKAGDSHLSSPTDLTMLHKMRTRVDVVMIGVGTQLKDNPRLTVRRARGRNPVRVVVDSKGRTPVHSKILSEPGRTIVAVSKRAPRGRLAILRHAGAEILTCGADRVNLRALLGKLYKMKFRRVLLEGGGELNWSMLVGNLVDEIRVAVVPFVVGGKKATSLVEGVGVKKTSNAIRLSLTNIGRHGNELVLYYKVSH